MALKKIKVLIYPTTWVNPQRIILSGKKTILKGYILYDSIYMTLMKLQNYRCGEQIGDFLRLKKELEREGSGYDYNRAT